MAVSLTSDPGGKFLPPTSTMSVSKGAIARLGAPVTGVALAVGVVGVVDGWAVGGPATPAAGAAPIAKPSVTTKPTAAAKADSRRTGLVMAVIIEERKSTVSKCMLSFNIVVRPS